MSQQYKDDLGFEQEIEEKKQEDSNVGSWIEINFSMPKLTLTLLKSNDSLCKKPICVLRIQDIAVQLTMKTMPEQINFNFSLESLEIEDKRVNDEVVLQHPELQKF